MKYTSLPESIVLDGAYFRQEQRLAPGSAYKELTRVHAGDFVSSEAYGMGGGSRHCAAFMRRSIVVSPEFPVFRVKTDKVLPDVLATIFSSPDVWSELARLSTGTNIRRRRLNATSFLTYRIPVPPMEAQVRVVSIKKKFDEVNGLGQEVQEMFGRLLAALLEREFGTFSKRN